MLKAPVVLAFAVAAATLIPLSIAFTPYGPKIEAFQKPLTGVYNNAYSEIKDPRGDVEPANLARGYLDILGASVEKHSLSPDAGDAFFLTINLAGNPNTSEGYETLYRWHIITTSQTTGRDQQYTILFPHFSGSSNSTNKGWYFVVYDETVDATIKGPVRISNMPNDRIEFPVEDFYIVAPTKFVYWVDVSVRLNATDVGEPDYMVDYAPSK